MELGCPVSKKAHHFKKETPNIVNQQVWSVLKAQSKINGSIEGYLNPFRFFSKDFVEEMSERVKSIDPSISLILDESLQEPKGTF